MKNTFVKLLLLAALVSCLFIFASCSSSLGVSIEDAEEIFEDDDDWTVSVMEPEEGLVKAYLSAYNREDEDDTKSFHMYEYIDEDLAKMMLESKELDRDNDLKEMKMELEELELELEQIQTILEDYKSELEDEVADMYDENIDELEEEIKELEKEIDEWDDTYKMGRDGAVVWYGDIEGYELLTGK